MSLLNIALAQLNLTVGDFSGNASKMIDVARDAHARGADILLTPELSLAGYPPEDLLLRPSFLQQCDAALLQLARDLAVLRGLHVVVGHPSPVANTSIPLVTDDFLQPSVNVRATNRATLMYEGRILGHYDKRILPNDGVFDEYRYFQAGRQTFVFTLKGVKVALLICEDVWHSEPSTLAVAAGAQLVLVSNASPYHIGKEAQREAVLQARVQETGVPHIYVNSVGGQDELIFDGGSFAVDQQGQVALRLPQFVENLAVLRYDDGQLLTQVTPVLTYAQREAQIYAALVLGVRDYVNKNGFSSVIIGLSGGVDSALVLAIACDALGKEKVTAVMMPSRYTADISQIDAQQMALNLGVRYEEIAITPLVDAFSTSLANHFPPQSQTAHVGDVTAENIQARVRGVLLMALANKHGSIVLTTSNKSELAVGYCTLYGDMAGGFAVIKDIPKMMVYRLCEWRNAHAEIIPKRILTRAPSAELRPNQTDQDSLPPYEILDAIVQAYVEKNDSVDEIIAQGYSETDVLRVVRLIKINEHKRRQSAIGVRITARAFGRDWRYPISAKFSE